MQLSTVSDHVYIPSPESLCSLYVFITSFGILPGMHTEIVDRIIFSCLVVLVLSLSRLQRNDRIEAELKGFQIENYVSGGGKQKDNETEGHRSEGLCSCL